MLFCLSEKKVGVVVEFLYYNILREGAVFKRACARVRGFFRKKRRKSPETAFAGDLTLCLETGNLQKREGG